MYTLIPTTHDYKIDTEQEKLSERALVFTWLMAVRLAALSRTHRSRLTRCRLTRTAELKTSWEVRCESSIPRRKELVRL